MNKNHILLIFLGLMMSWRCQAFDYILDPRFDASQRYDTNLTMLPPDLLPQDNWISTVSPGLDFGFHSENSEFKSNFTWNHIFYNNQSELDFDEQLLSTNFKHFGEKFNWGLIASYNSRSSLNTEASASGSGVLNLKQVRRRDFNIEPSVTYNFDDRNSFKLDYNYLDVKFPKSTDNNAFFLTSYTSHFISATLSHLFTEYDRFSLIFSSSIYDNPGQVIPGGPFGFIGSSLVRNPNSKSGQNTTSHTLQIGWQHTFTEQFTASITGGGRYTETEQTFTQTGQSFNDNPVALTTKTKSSGLGHVFNASLQKSFERGSISFNAYQQLTPTAIGNQNQTFLGLNSTYNLYERWSTGLSGSYSIYEQSTQQQNNSNNRTYYDISPYISWRWTPEINLQLSYTYRQIDYETENQAREGNIAQFLFTYQPQINRQVK